jgi:hypothetical protein
VLKFVVAGMAVVILVLAGVTGFLVYENVSEDDGGGTTRGESTTPTGWEAVSYEDKHSICHEFATTVFREGATLTNDDAYKACMKCGPEKAQNSGTWFGWTCLP